MNDTAAPETIPDDSLMGRIADDFLARLDAGEQPRIDEYTRKHPSLADAIREVLPALSTMRALSPDAGDSFVPGSEDATTTRRLGDYRIIREVGRGGMGVVYEAEQVSLRRRVALKVLPFAAVLDPKQLPLFKNEAQAAAALDHPGIVSI